MDHEDELYTPDSLTKHRARLSRFLWVLIIGMFAFIASFGIYSLWHGINRYQVEGLGAAQLQTAQPQTADEVVQLVAPGHKWTEATIVCPYVDVTTLPEYAQHAVRGAGLGTEADNLSYWVTNAERALIIRGIDQVQLCSNADASLQLHPQTKVAVKETTYNLVVSISAEK